MRPAIGASVLLLLTTFVISRLSFTSLVALAPDDAYFYFKTASHVAEGHGSTFDGVNRTNGYHPLHLGLLTALSSVVPLRGHTGLIAVVWLDGLLAIGWFFVMAALAHRLGWTRGQVWGLLCLLAPIVVLADFGMESNLLLPLAWGFVLATTWASGRPAREWMAGIVGALACLARLDAIAFVGIVALAALATRNDWGWPLRRSSVVSAFRLLLPAAVALGGFSLVNTVLFGHAPTIASWLKAGSPAGLTHFDISLHSLVLVVAVAAGLAAAIRAAFSRTPHDIRVGSLGAWAALYVTAMSIKSPVGMEIWYFPLPVSAALVAVVGVGRAWLGAFRVVLVSAAVAAIALAAVGLRLQVGRVWPFADPIADPVVRLHLHELPGYLRQGLFLLQPGTRRALGRDARRLPARQHRLAVDGHRQSGNHGLPGRATGHRLPLLIGPADGGGRSATFRAQSPGAAGPRWSSCLGGESRYNCDSIGRMPRNPIPSRFQNPV